MKKWDFKRVLSFVLCLVMIVGVIPANTFTAFAASNIAGTFEGQDADVFSALGFDTSEEPEGYDAETTENPYGREKLPGNQVFELLITGAEGARLFGNNNNGVSVSGISGEPSANSNHGLVMSAVAAGDFDGDGLAGEVVYVGYKAIKYNIGVKKQISICVFTMLLRAYTATQRRSERSIRHR